MWLGVVDSTAPIRAAPFATLAAPRSLLPSGRSCHCAICTIGSVLGGLLGYAIGYFVYDAFGQQLLQWLHLADKFPSAACYLREYGAQLIIVKGATPIPFKLVTITAGFIHMNLFTFVWASIVSRGFQFMLVGLLFRLFGAWAKAFIEKYLGLLQTDGKTSNYDVQANEDLAKNLKGKLLLAHGMLDDNVPVSSTLLVVDALEKANKDFDLILFPRAHHGYGDMSNYMMRRRWDYFVENLMGATPPKEFKIVSPGADK